MKTTLYTTVNGINLVAVDGMGENIIMGFPCDIINRHFIDVIKNDIDPRPIDRAINIMGGENQHNDNTAEETKTTAAETASQDAENVACEEKETTDENANAEADENEDEQ